MAHKEPDVQRDRKSSNPLVLDCDGHRATELHFLSFMCEFLSYFEALQR